jgi:hypothetical protein
MNVSMKYRNLIGIMKKSGLRLAIRCNPRNFKLSTHRLLGSHLLGCLLSITKLWTVRERAWKVKSQANVYIIIWALTGTKVLG